MEGAQLAVAELRKPGGWRQFRVFLYTFPAVVLAMWSIWLAAGVLVLLIAAIAAHIVWAGHDDRQREQTWDDELLASARASSFAFQVRRFDPTIDVRGRWRSRKYGVVEIRADELRWRTLKATPFLASIEIVVPWTDVAAVQCRRAQSVIALTACWFRLHDGRELTLYATNPDVVERALERCGVYEPAQGSVS